MRFQIVTTDTDIDYSSWEAYINSIPPIVLRQKCATVAKHANRRFIGYRLTADDIITIITDAKGRCYTCNSLCIERRPTRSNGGPLPWEHVGRRIGSLAHKIDDKRNLEANNPSNLGWQCLWCNLWSSQRIMHATDHGGIQN